jgi:4-carboxymuconolactone decarboxylase
MGRGRPGWVGLVRAQRRPGREYPGASRAVEVTVSAESTDSPDDPGGRDERWARGIALIREVHGEEGAALVESLGDLGRYVGEFGFGDVYSRGTLPLRERQIATISMLTAMGGKEPQLRIHMRAALDSGVTPRELEELTIHAVVYCGFPAAINALLVLRELLEEAEAPAR